MMTMINQTSIDRLSTSRPMSFLPLSLSSSLSNFFAVLVVVVPECQQMIPPHSSHT
jgi:hypothetical protein